MRGARIETRILGRTGHSSTVVTLGMAGFGDVSQDTADETIQLALDHGVNHVNVAPGYGEAMERLAPWMHKIRGRVLGAKTHERAEDGAWRNIHECMERLGVDSFDLFQLHGVCTLEDLDAVTASDGALRSLVRMREQGLTRWIGITGHGAEAPRTHLEALRRFDFDTVMFPVNSSIYRKRRLPRRRRKAAE